jgi:hypothetical protein
MPERSAGNFAERRKQAREFKMLIASPLRFTVEHRKGT